jgi:UPF0755 protein
VLVLFARLFVNPISPDTTRITIATGSAWPFPPLSSEARALSALLRARADELNTPFSDDLSLVSLTIEPGETAVDVAWKLQSAGLVGDAQLFTHLLRYNGLDTQLQAGEYQFRRNMTMREIGEALYRGRSAQLVVTVPAGWRMEELADHVAAAGIMDGRLFLRQAAAGTAIPHVLLADRPAGQSYEGYLFPGTYRLPDNPTPQDLIGQMLDKMAAQLPPDVFSLARQRGLTFYQVLTLASIVERETMLPQEKPIIASVYLNRLKPDSGQPHLQADPTVQYGLGYQPSTGYWWKTFITPEEYHDLDSPYNTYRYPGLPPGPIASPSLETIMAVLRPADTDYLFFVCQQPDCEGGDHVFASTYEEHLQNARVYWGN